jgi:multiple sugar transport system ATP-binding protein
MLAAAAASTVRDVRSPRTVDAMADIVFAGVSKVLDGRPILIDVDLTIPSGSLTALVGPSGSGKTSLLRMAAGLLRPDTGTVTVGGRDLNDARAGDLGVAMMFQDDALYSHLDVGGNLRFPLEVRGADAAHVAEVARRSARRAGVLRFWDRRPATLSTGEQGMVAAGRAISRDGLEVLLLDEPLARADRHIRRRFRTGLRRLHETEGVTTVLATNDQEEAMAVADRLVVVADGRIAQVGTPRAVFEDPETAAVAAFVGILPMNLFPGAVRRSAGGDHLEVGADRIDLDRPPLTLTEADRVLVGLHAHELFVAPPGTPFGRTMHVTVGRVEHLGATSNVLFGLGRSAVGTFVMSENRPAASRPGDRLELTWAPGRMRLFRADTGRAIPM